MKRRLLAPVLAAAILLALTSAVAFANVIALTVNLNPVSVGKIATATGEVNCTVGHPVQIDVTIYKGTGSGTGETFLTCTGLPQHWTVNVIKTKGKWGVGRADETVTAFDSRDMTSLTQSVDVFLVP